MNADKRLIVAIDVDTMEKVQQLVETLGDAVSYYKVGMELFYSVGDQVIAYLSAQGKDVFLDLKLQTEEMLTGKSTRSAEFIQHLNEESAKKLEENYTLKE